MEAFQGWFGSVLRSERVESPNDPKLSEQALGHWVLFQLSTSHFQTFVWLRVSPGKVVLMSRSAFRAGALSVHLFAVASRLMKARTSYPSFRLRSVLSGIPVTRESSGGIAVQE